MANPPLSIPSAVSSILVRACLQQYPVHSSMIVRAPSIPTSFAGILHAASAQSDEWPANAAGAPSRHDTIPESGAQPSLVFPWYQKQRHPPARPPPFLSSPRPVSVAQPSPTCQPSYLPRLPPQHTAPESGAGSTWASQGCVCPSAQQKTPRPSPVHHHSGTTRGARHVGARRSMGSFGRPRRGVSVPGAKGPGGAGVLDGAAVLVPALAGRRRGSMDLGCGTSRYLDFEVCLTSMIGARTCFCRHFFISDLGGSRKFRVVRDGSNPASTLSVESTRRAC
ncbi:hypothetical protein BC830DRAFT_687262 [Chytriomyces sp. MP71]|nr:hypothetical protein BC830DRAFT_687262 [Chytriomyces sp. MP71]